MSRYVFGFLGIIVGFIVFGWLVVPKRTTKATWPVEMSDGSTVMVFLEEDAIDVFRLPWAKFSQFLYRDYGRNVSLPIMPWEGNIDDCAKKCKVERNGDNIVIKFPFTKDTGVSQYEFTPAKQPLLRTEPPGPRPAAALGANSSH